MSDLRTRIAAALLGDHCIQGMTQPCDDCREHALRQADAVIRELEADYIRALLPQREGAWGWLDGTVSTNPATGNPIKLEIEPGEVIPLSVDDARDVALALLAAVVDCGEDSDA